MEIGTRIAAAQLTGSARSKRQVVAGPLAGLLHESDTWFLSGMLAAEPGQQFDPDEIPWALDTIRRAFAAEGRWLSAELVEEASPGLAEALAANGMTIVSHLPLLVVEPADLVVADLPDGVTVKVVASEEDRRWRTWPRRRRTRWTRPASRTSRTRSTAERCSCP